MTQIRISYVRATFAAGLLTGVRSSLLKITDLLEAERDLEIRVGRRSGVAAADPGPIDASGLVAAALFAAWIADTLQQQIAFYFELDHRLAGTFDSAELPPTDTRPQAPPEWPQPSLPAPLIHIPNPLTDGDKSPESTPPRAQIAVQMREILENLDDAIKAIGWSRNVRLQAQITDAAMDLRAWVVTSTPALTGD